MRFVVSTKWLPVIGNPLVKRKSSTPLVLLQVQVLSLVTLTLKISKLFRSLHSPDRKVGVFYFLKFSLESDLVGPEVEFVWRYYMVPHKMLSHCAGW